MLAFLAITGGVVSMIRSGLGNKLARQGPRQSRFGKTLDWAQDRDALLRLRHFYRVAGWVLLALGFAALVAHIAFGLA